MRVVLRYDPRFSRPGVWMVQPGGIRARFRLGSAEETVLDAWLYWRRVPPAHMVDMSAYVRPLDEHTFLTETSRFGDVLDVAIILQLNDAPPHAASFLRAL